MDRKETMNHSFHGRSIGVLSVTGNPHYQEAFRPLMGGVRFADFNDLEGVKAQVTDKTCAVILSAENNVLRFVPPLVITEADVDEMIKRMELSL